MKAAMKMLFPLVLMLLPSPLRAAWDADRLTVPVVVAGHTIPFKQFAVFVMPNQTFEVSITIINPVEYLNDGETWTVRFTTNGTADLVINSTNAGWGEMLTDVPGTFDEVSYHNLALRVMDGHGFSFGERWWPGTAGNEPTAHWSYLYTIYLVVIYSIFGPSPLLARLLQAIVVGAELNSAHSPA